MKDGHNEYTEKESQQRNRKFRGKKTEKRKEINEMSGTKKLNT